ncbi:Sulfate adenylyltransferase subunit 1 [Cystobacter fuscus DSM 2262]|uniref:sulfate adenylyltransferase n=1 Tax=Cystobacter fuscus (strain ATCC 25194 / DSM 2262 / NBRC 100088 / M29) TaxID=1242864 RepID=S9P0G3_CYSF2|nr:GTP-binding protein [Cystobacter fuscus]EPX55757.1 Sulfate adenylyltransferase subunit 1 [Cystobacter fuscus DSM 2262]
MSAETQVQGRTDVQGFLAEHAEKELLRLAVVGSVDDGKSTLIGRLLYECNGLFEDQVAAVKRASAGGEIDFSLFTDGLRAEREQGITIDVAYRYFSTKRRKVIVADTPGHLQYTRNMATGASTADAAVILVDARLGILPQTRRHAYIASLLGIPYLAVAINKMDLMDFDPAVFQRLATEFEAFSRTLGFEQVRFFPISARTGDNITQPSARTPWHDGETLLGWLETLPHERRQEDAAFRFPVQYVLRPDLDYRGFAGQIVSGKVRLGDEVVVYPSRRRTHIASIDTFEGRLEEASAPASVTLRLTDEVDISRGDQIAHAEQPPRVLQDMEAMLVWFGEERLDTSRRYLVKHTSKYVPAHIEQVLWRKELEDLSEQPAPTLGLNDIAKVRLVCKRPVVCDPYRDNRRTGAFIVVDPLTNDTVAAGMILGGAGGQGADETRSLVSASERRERLGQSGAVLLLTGTPEVRDAALRLERALFDQGRHTATVRGDAENALALAEAGLLAILYTPVPQARLGLREQLRGAGVPWLELEPSEDVDTQVKRVLDAQEKTP